MDRSLTEATHQDSAVQETGDSEQQHRQKSSHNADSSATLADTMVLSRAQMFLTVSVSQGIREVEPEFLELLKI